MKKVNHVKNVTKMKKIGHVTKARYSKGHLEYEVMIDKPLSPYGEDDEVKIEIDDINPSARDDGASKKETRFKGAFCSGSLYGTSPLVPQITYNDIIEAIRKSGKWMIQKQDEYLNDLLKQNS